MSELYEQTQGARKTSVLLLSWSTKALEIEI